MMFTPLLCNFAWHSVDKKSLFSQDDRMTAARLANTMWTSMKGRPVQGRIFQGKEPPQFIALFQPMVVLKGGLSTGYKKSVEEQNVKDETYASDGIALIRVSGTSVHNNKAVQVDAVAASLNSYDCFLLQSGNTLFIWQGTSSTFEQHQWATNIAEFLKPGAGFKHAKEGTESSAFWFTLGGKQSFSSNKVTTDIVRDPHLYTFSFNKVLLQVSEVFNFVQDDLLSEDMLILDTHSEVFIWIGQCVETKDKQKAFDIGQKYIELAMCLEGLASDVPLYKVTEGNEPCFFTAYFSWDSAKAAAHGNSFEKKLAILFGTIFHASESKDKSNNASQSGPTQRASALAALSSAFNPHSQSKPTNPIPARSTKGSSQRAAAVAALSSVLTAEQKKAQVEGSARRFGRNSPPDSNATGSFKEETASSVVWDPAEDSAENADVSQSNDVNSEENQDTVVGENADENTYSYERLKAKSRKPVTGIDYKQREAYLSDEEFQTVFGMTKQAFYQQPKWKQDMQKRKFDLF
ncbi:Villin-2 [Dendrobium catenatum]|uniref:Villin-2 n=1 Tax=Dendrobium catenatum TaxID=906689 RepID=A0A2I0WNE3_9ASPA|nr:Villin-2 [Dendrobium catenatum]